MPAILGRRKAPTLGSIAQQDFGGMESLCPDETLFSNDHIEGKEATG